MVCWALTIDAKSGIGNNRRKNANTHEQKKRTPSASGGIQKTHILAGEEAKGSLIVKKREGGKGLPLLSSSSDVFTGGVNRRGHPWTATPLGKDTEALGGCPSILGWGGNPEKLEEKKVEERPIRPSWVERKASGGGRRPRRGGNLASLCRGGRLSLRSGRWGAFCGGWPINEGRKGR